MTGQDDMTALKEGKIPLESSDILEGEKGSNGGSFIRAIAERTATPFVYSSI